jgi:Mg-chelatase subunit ChlD
MIHVNISDRRESAQDNPTPASTPTCELSETPALRAATPSRERAATTAPRAARARAALLVLVALGILFFSPAHAQTAATLDAALDHKEDAVLDFKLALEAARLGISNGTLSNATCEVYSSCSAELARPFCHFNYGNSAGCGCDSGRTVDSTNSVVKSSPLLDASAYSVKRTACEATHVDPTLRDLYGSMIEQGDAKWLFYGSKDGVLINFPGIVWDEDVNDDTCGASYDARIRPWHMAGATGPKNLVLILDTSGSMSQYDRISLLKSAAKAVLDATTFADFVGVVRFGSSADTYAGLTTLARALPDFKEDLKRYVDGFYPSGGTNMIDGFERAFRLVDDSRSKSYEAGCHTTYVLVTDGAWNEDPGPTIAARQASTSGADEHFFVVGLGSGVSESDLRGLSCDTGAIYTHADDGDESALQRAMISFYKYFALFKSVAKVEGFSWSEPYVSIPSIWGKMVHRGGAGVRQEPRAVAHDGRRRRRCHRLRLAGGQGPRPPRNIAQDAARVLRATTSGLTATNVIPGARAWTGPSPGAPLRTDAGAATRPASPASAGTTASRKGRRASYRRRSCRVPRPGASPPRWTNARSRRCA